MKLLKAAILSTLLTLSAQAADYTPFSSFDIIKFPFVSAKVSINGRTLYLLEIDGVSAEVIIEKCIAEYTKGNCETMFVEDFKGTMVSLGYTLGGTVKFKLYDLSTHDSKIYIDFSLEPAN